MAMQNPFDRVVPVGFYNYVNRRSALLHLRRITLVLDIGANVGQFAATLRRENLYGGRIVSFEPLADAFAELQKASADDPLWECHNLALGDIDGEATINVSANSQSSSLLPATPRSLAIEPSIRYVRQQNIAVRRLDNLLGQIALPNDVILLKVDAQGYEMKILAGAAGVLERFELIQLESSFFPSYEGETLAGDMINHLDSLGYRVVGAEPAWIDQKTGELLQVDFMFGRKFKP